MADGITVHIDTKAVEEKLSRLPQELQNKYMKESYRAAGDVMLGAVHDNTPVRDGEEDSPDSTSLPPGIMQEDMTLTVTKSGVKVGPTEISGARARWINDGWQLTLNGKKVKDIPGQHFMERAFDECAQEALDAFVETLTELINNDEGGS